MMVYLFIIKKNLELRYKNTYAEYLFPFTRIIKDKECFFTLRLITKVYILYIMSTWEENTRL